MSNNTFHTFPLYSAALALLTLLAGSGSHASQGRRRFCLGRVSADDELSGARTNDIAGSKALYI